MLLSFPGEPVTLPPPRNYMVFAIILALWRVRLQVPQTTYKERTRSEFTLSPALWIHRKQSRHPETVSEDIPWQHLICKCPSWSCAAGQEKGLFLWHLFWNIHQLRRPGIYFPYLPCVFVGCLPSILPWWNILGCVTVVFFHGVALQGGTAVFPELRLARSAKAHCVLVLLSHGIKGNSVSHSSRFPGIISW